MNRFHWSLCPKFRCKLWPWLLIPRYGSCSRHIVLSWWSFVPNYFQIPLCIIKLWVGDKQVSLNSIHKVAVRTVILIFALVTWFLFVTHCLVTIIIYAKLFFNFTMHNKVMGRTWTGFTEGYAQNLSADCDLDLWPSDMALVCDTLSF